MIGDSRNNTALSLISIYEISKILSSSLDLEKTLRDVLNLLSSYLQMCHGIVALKDERGRLTVIAATGASPQAVRGGAIALAPEIGERICSSGMPLVVPSIEDDPEFAEHLSVSGVLDGEVVSFIGVPIKATEKPFGVLCVDRAHDEGQAVNFESDVRFLTMVANLIGQTVRMHKVVASDRQRLMSEQSKLRQNSEDPREAARRYQVDNVIGRSEAMEDLFEQVHQIAPSKSTVLIRGESGTGKELIARAIHHLSPRREKVFVKVNCAALPETLLESELFGHEKGAFTGATQERKGRFEMAAGGSLFLDEIGEISPAFQAKLLRVLQEGEFERVGGNKTLKTDFRLVCATNKDLETAVAEGDFRADLYYRINVVPLTLPSLRERPDDIPLLAQHFLDQFNEENDRELRFDDAALDVLSGCYFPGNVRELENCVERVATLARAETISDIDLACQRDQCLSAVLWKAERPAGGRPVGGLGAGPSASQRQASVGCSSQTKRPVNGADPGGCDGCPGSEVETVEEFDGVGQRDRLLQAMEKSGWVQAKAARILGLTPRQVGYALKKYNIEVKRI